MLHLASPSRTFIARSRPTSERRQTGFGIEEIIEPTLEAVNLKRFPQLDDELRVPNFIVVVLQKPQMHSRPLGRRVAMLRLAKNSISWNLSCCLRPDGRSASSTVELEADIHR